MGTVEMKQPAMGMKLQRKTNMDRRPKPGNCRAHIPKAVRAVLAAAILACQKEGILYKSNNLKKKLPGSLLGEVCHYCKERVSFSRLDAKSSAKIMPSEATKDLNLSKHKLSTLAVLGTDSAKSLIKDISMILSFSPYWIL